MRKKRLTFLCAVAVFCITAIAVSWSASAAVTKNAAFTDDFNRAELGGNWAAANGAAIDIERHAMRINECYDWNGNVILTKYKMESDCTLEFTATSFALGGWFAVAMGNASVNAGFSAASAALIFTASPTGLTQLFVNRGTSLADSGIAPLNFAPFAYGKQGEDIAVRLEFSKRADTEDNYDILYSVTDVNSDEEIGAHTYSAEIRDGYFSFNTNNVGTDISDFKIYEGETLVFSDDFQNSSVCYPSVNKDTVWKIPYAYTAADVTVGAIGCLDLSQNGSSVRYAAPLAVTASDSGKAFGASFKLNMQGMSEGAATGFTVGADENSEGGTFAGVRRTATGYSVFCKDGESESTGVRINQNSVIEPVPVTVILHGSGDLEVKTGTHTAVFSGKAKSGYIGFCSKFEGGGSGGKIDDFRLDTYTWESAEAPDAATNFSGVRETAENGTTYKDYYLSANEWYFSSGASLPKYRQDHKNGYMQFIDCNPLTAFGPRNKYSDYTLRFDVTLLSDTESGVRDGEGFGISVGRPSLYMNAEKSQAIYFVQFNGKSIVKGFNALDESGNAEKEVTDDGTASGQNHNFWKSKAITYNMLYVVKNGCVSVYFKESGESEEKLDILRARYVGLNTYGYATVVGMNNAKFKIENFSLTNIDVAAKAALSAPGEHIENMRCDFSCPDCLSFTRKTELGGGRAKMLPGGKLTVKGDVRNMLMRVNLASLSGDFEIKLGARHKIKLSDSNREICVQGFSAYEKVIGRNQNEPFKDCVLEISVTGRAFSLSLIRADEPLANLYEPLFNFGVGTNFILPRGEVSFCVNGGEATLSSFAIYNLDAYRTIADRNYNPETDYVNHRVPKPLKTDGKKIVIVVSCIAVAVILAAAGTVIAVKIIKRRKGNREKA